MPRDVGDRPLLLWEEVGRGGRRPMQGGKPRGQELLSKGLDGSTIMGTFRFMVFVAYRTENVFIFSYS